MSVERFTLARRVTAEAVGTAYLLAAVVGSGIMGERLSGGNVGLALLANTLATGAALVVLILTFGSISGAHFNPVVTLADASQRGMSWPVVPFYVSAQITGAFVGVGAAHLMFGEPLFVASRHTREGMAQAFSEFVATFGLLSVIWGCARLRSSAVPFAVGAYITAAYWFTASTSFANPAVSWRGPRRTLLRAYAHPTPPALSRLSSLGRQPPRRSFDGWSPVCPKSRPASSCRILIQTETLPPRSRSTDRPTKPRARRPGRAA